MSEVRAMSDGTRRVFLSRSGIGVAAAGVAALTPAAVLSARGSDTTAAATPDADLSAVRGSLVAFVHDVHATEVSLMVGEEEIVVQDKELVTRLLRAAAAK